MRAMEWEEVDYYPEKAGGQTALRKRFNFSDFKSALEFANKVGTVAEAFADALIDTSVRGIVTKLDLRRPIYQATSAYGHFGNPDFSWEQIA